MKLTPATVRTILLPEGKIDETFPDEDLPGLGLRVRAGGARTWVYRYKIGTQYRRMTLGNLAALTPAQARKAAGDLHAAVRLGRDPAGEKAEGRARVTMGAALAAYIPFQQSRLRPRSYLEVERHLNKHCRPLHGVQLAKIDRRAVAGRLAAIAEQSGAVQANRARASLAAFFAWCMRDGLADANPVAATGKRPERSRDRVLLPDEIKAIWAATAGPDDYAAVVRLLLLTGARLNEIAALRWNEIGDGEITLPAARTKGGRRHIIPLSPAARSILDGRPRRPDRDLVFGRRHDRPLCGWTELKAGLDARIAAAGEPLPHWTHHDIRRSVATGLAQLGIPPHVIEVVIGHAGHRSGISGVYNLATYEREKKQALGLWCEHLLALIEGRGREAHIVMFRQA